MVQSIDKLWEYLDYFANQVDGRKVNKAVMEYMENQDNISMWSTNSAYDCAEIADDFHDVEPSGHIIRISVADGRLLTPFTVLEYKNLVQYHYHTVYVKNDLVYDPRMWMKPLKKEDYEKMLRHLNPGIHFHFEMD